MQDTEELSSPLDVAAPTLLAEWEGRIQEMAKRRTRCRATRDDAAQAGRLALLAAAARFDPSIGKPFPHYASAAIRNGISKSIQRTQRSLSLRDHGGVAPTAVSFTAQVIPMVRDWLATLPKVLVDVFLAIYEQGCTQREAARRLGVSQPRVAALHRKLLDHGREEFVAVGPAELS